MNILEQAKDEEFVKGQFIKGRILDDTKDYGRTQFVDEIYKLQQENRQLQKELEEYKNPIKYFKYANKNVVEENKKLKDNWNKLKEWVNKQHDYYMNNKDYIGGRLCFTDMKDKMQELEGSDNQ